MMLTEPCVTFKGVPLVLMTKEETTFTGKIVHSPEKLAGPLEGAMNPKFIVRVSDHTPFAT